MNLIIAVVQSAVPRSEIGIGHRCDQPGAPGGCDRRRPRSSAASSALRSRPGCPRHSMRRRSRRSSCTRHPRPCRRRSPRSTAMSSRPIFVGLALDLRGRDRRRTPAPGRASRRPRAHRSQHRSTRHRSGARSKGTSMTSSSTVVIVGSGPIGSAYARVHPRGIADRAGRSCSRPARSSPSGRARACATSPTPTRRRARASGRRDRRRAPSASQLGIPPGVVVEGMFTARQGTHLLDFGGEGSAHAPTFPAAAAATNVGGQGAHWTCGDPEPGVQRAGAVHRRRTSGSDLSRRRQPNCCTCSSAAFADSAVGGAIRVAARRGVRRRAARGLRPEHPARRGRPAARRHDALGRRRRRARTAHRTGRPARRALRAARPHARAPHRARRRASSPVSTVEDLRTHEASTVAADVVVVAADAFRSPQLLWASGIRPTALGHYLTEHPVVISTVALDAERMSRFATEDELDAELARRAKNAADPVAAVNRIPFSEPGHPVLAAGDVRREPAVPDGVRRAVRRQPLGLREHGLRHAQAPAVRGRRHLRRRRTRLPRAART